jgi:hypothetical protein
MASTAAKEWGGSAWSPAAVALNSPAIFIIGADVMKGWPEGNHTANVMADVGFENAATGNYRRKPESPFLVPKVRAQTWAHCSRRR